MKSTASGSRFSPGELESLMEQYQKSDSKAVSVLIEKLSPSMFHFFLAQVRDRARAEDLLQDFWLRIHSARHTYRPLEPVLPWMYAIARRVKIDQYRRTRRIAHHEVQVESLPEAVPPSKQVGADIDLPALLEQLPDSQREVVVMLKVSGLSLEEVALATQSSIGSVKQKAHRAYAKLRGILGQPAETRHRRPADAV